MSLTGATWAQQDWSPSFFRMEHDLFISGASLQWPCMTSHSQMHENSPKSHDPKDSQHFLCHSLFRFARNFLKSNQSAGHLSSNCSNEQKSIGPVFFPWEGELAEMSSCFPYLHGHFLLTGNDNRERKQRKQRKIVISATMAKEEGLVGGKAIFSALSEQWKTLILWNLRGELKAWRDLGGNLFGSTCYPVHDSLIKQPARRAGTKSLLE